MTAFDVISPRTMIMPVFEAVSVNKSRMSHYGRKRVSNNAKAASNATATEENSTESLIHMKLPLNTARCCQHQLTHHKLRATLGLEPGRHPGRHRKLDRRSCLAIAVMLASTACFAGSQHYTLTLQHVTPSMVFSGETRLVHGWQVQPNVPYQDALHRQIRK